MKSTIIWGGEGQAKVLAEFIPALGIKVIAIFDNSPELPSPIDGVPIFHGTKEYRKWIAQHGIKELGFLVAVGRAGRDRLNIHKWLLEEQLEPLTVVHPTAYVGKDVTISRGSQIMAHATVCVESRIGEACIINTKANVDHESTIEDGVHVGPGAILCGCVNVGEGAFIGAGATVLPRVSIGADAIVGAGSVVTRNVENGQIVAGNPARLIRMDKV